MVKPQGRFRAAVIGCGQIGTGFDSPGDEPVLTHAGAFTAHPAYELVGLFDSDPAALDAASRKWGCPGYASIDALLTHAKPEVVSVCAPDQHHLHCLGVLVESDVRGVICEKPICPQLGDAERIVGLFGDRDIPLLINYTRAFDTSWQSLKDQLDQGSFGRIQHITVRYTKGLLHNGSHALQLILTTLGPMIGQTVLSQVVDYREDDPTISAHLCFERCAEVMLLACDERLYSIFEIDVVGEHRRALFDEGGFRLTEFRVRNDPIFTGYKDLEKMETIPTGLGDAMRAMVANMANFLTGTSELKCPGTQAVDVQRACQRILVEARRHLGHHA